MNFKDWITFCEQPHVYAKKPVSFALNGKLYQDVYGLDPRIEQWPDRELKFRFFRHHISENLPIYFIDDQGQSFQIHDHELTQVPQADPKYTMPAYWHHKAQFRIGHDVIDNMLHDTPTSATA